MGRVASIQGVEGVEDNSIGAIALMRMYILFFILKSKNNSSRQKMNTQSILSTFATSGDVLVVDPSAVLELGSDGIASILCSLSPAKAKAWWGSLAANPLLEESLAEAVDPSEAEGMAPPLRAWLEATLLAMRGVAAPTPGSDVAAVQPPAGFFTTLHYLHNALIHVRAEKLQESIARLCEVWWASGVEGCEALVAQLTPYRALVLLSRGRSATAADVQRLWALRDALLIFDTEDASFDSLRKLLLRCATLPVIHRAAIGRRLLAFLFARISAAFMLEMHQVIMAQVVEATKRSKMPAHFGEVYWRAWNLCSDAIAGTSESAETTEAEASEAQLMKRTFEERCVQDAMSRCVRTGSTALHGIVRNLLAAAFHAHKKDAGADALLCRLWEPILWRSLRAPHPTLRLHATHILCDAFPIQDPDGLDSEENAALLERQFVALNERMRDDDPKVRTSAARGACRVLASFWKLTSAQHRRKLLCTLVDDLANDVASTAVRVAVMEGIAVIVEECTPARSVLKSLLPRLRKSIHDRSPRVRAALLSILLAVKSVRGIHFSKVVPLNQILARLATDGATTKVTSGKGQSKSVAILASELLANSYFPAGSGRHHLERCIALLQHNADAARVFYANAHRFIPTKEIIALAILIVRFVDKCPQDAVVVTKKKTKGKKRKSAAAEADMEAESAALVSEVAASKSDIALMTLLLETANTLWSSVSDALTAAPDAASSGKSKKKSKAKVAAFHKALSGSVMPRLIASFGSDPQACAAVLGLASHLPMGAVPALKKSVLDGVTALLDASVDASLYHIAPLVDTMCSWEQEAVLVNDMVAPCLARIFDSSSSSSSPSSSDAQKAAAALDILSTLLQTDVVGSRARTLALIAAEESTIATLFVSAAHMMKASIANPSMHASIQPLLLRAAGVSCMVELHSISLGLSAEEDSNAKSSGGVAAIHRLALAAQAALQEPEFTFAGMTVGESSEDGPSSACTPAKPPRRRSKKSSPAVPSAVREEEEEEEEEEGDAMLLPFGARVIALACTMVAEGLVLGEADDAGTALVADITVQLRGGDTRIIAAVLPQELGRLALTSSACKLDALREAGQMLTQALEGSGGDENAGCAPFLAASRKVASRAAASQRPLTTAH